MDSNEHRNKVNKLFTEYLNEISSDEGADNYLRGEGLNPTDLVNDGLRKIRQMKMQIESSKTQSSYLDITAKLLATAKEEVKRLMETPSFDFNEFLKKERLTVAYRNFESMNDEEIREFLEKHILLKLQKGSEGEQKT